ncbi:hypothetical protein SESBI_32569 [Sesbania bispinosa]|nr:hypothetical protein SESBI_32569 [Sesbania bispinosa]
MGEFTPTLEDVHVLLKLSLSGDLDITTSSIDSHIIDRAKQLKATTIESAKYSREFLSRLRSKPPAAFDSKTPSRKVKGTGNVLPPEKRKVPRESLKYTFATWVRYFFGDVEKDPPTDGEDKPLEPRIWSWTMGRPRHPLLDLIDEEDQFIHRPYVASFFPDIEGLHRIYKENEFTTQNIRSSRSEGVFDIWHLIFCSQILPGFIITDTVSIAGGAYWPFAYRLDRVVLFKLNSSLPPFDAGKFIPSKRAGRVLDLWIAYYARLKNSVKRYEAQDSMQHFTNVQIMCKDPYFVTTAIKTLDTQAKEPPRVSGKKRKPAATSKVKKGVSSSCEVVPPLPKKATRGCKSVPSTLVNNSLSPVVKKYSSTRSAKVKKEIPLPTRASQRLRAKSKTNLFPPFSFSSPIVLQASNTDEPDHDGEVIQESPLSPRDKSVTPSSSEDRTVSGKKGKEQVNSEHASTPSDDAISVKQGDEVKKRSVASPDAEVSEAPTLERAHSPKVVSSQALSLVMMASYYSFFAGFLRFMRAHPYMDLFSVHKDKVVGDLKTLRCLGFNGTWLDDLFAQFDRPVPAVAFENLQQAMDAIRLQEQHSLNLQSQITALIAELAQGEVELARLNAKCKEINDARMGLDVNFCL